MRGKRVNYVGDTEYPHVESSNLDDALKERILEALLEVEDPELQMDIVDLGLVYRLDLDESGVLTVTMSLTSMGCPLAGSIVELVKQALADIPEIEGTQVEIVWNPPWTPDRMSKLARYALGFHRS